MSTKSCTFAVIASAIVLMTPSISSAQSAADSARKAAADGAKATFSRGANNTPSQAANAARSGFDTPSRAPNPVRAQPAAKPNMVGQPVYSRPGVPGFKPQQQTLRTNPVPSPVVSRSTTTASAPVRSTTTVRSEEHTSELQSH